MKRVLMIIPIGLLSVLLFSVSAVAQEKPFVVLEYMHVKPGSNNAYLQVEKFWRHIHLAQQKNGDILTWSVWKVVAPYNMNAPYQYVAVTVYAHFSDYLHPYKDIDMHKVFPDASPDSLKKMFSETQAARDLIRSDIFKVGDYTGVGKGTKYAMVYYVKVLPGKGQDFQSFMNSHRRPIHEDILKKGLEKAWWYGGLMFGDGDKAPYNHIIVVQWERDDMFDKLPAFAQYKKNDPAAFEDHQWLTDDHIELLQKMVSLDSGTK